MPDCRVQLDFVGTRNGGSGVHFRRSCKKAKQGSQESGWEGIILMGCHLWGRICLT